MLKPLSIKIERGFLVKQDTNGCSLNRKEVIGQKR